LALAGTIFGARIFWNETPWNVWAFATDTFPRAVIAGHEASVLLPNPCSPILAANPCRGCDAARHFLPILPLGSRCVLLRRMSLHVSNAAISLGSVQAARGK
jgi:hypothetical protein